ERPTTVTGIGRLLRLLALIVALLAIGSASAAPADAAGPTLAGAAGPSPSPSPVVIARTRVPIVPVRDYRTSTSAVDRDDLVAALSGARGYEALELVAADADAILAAFSLPATDQPHLVRAPTAHALARDLAAHRERLGILRASQVGPAVRALGWGKRSLFGVDRVRDLDGWPLWAVVPSDGSPDPYDPSDAWTIVAAGDVMLDRGVRAAIDRHGADFPFDGGTARITGRRCCSSLGWRVPISVRTGNAGAVRALLAGADLSIVNLEGPAPKRATYHPDGLVFTFTQASLKGLDRAGIDIVSLANNHIGNAGRAGIVETVAALDRLGIDHAGAGATARAARAPALRTVGGIRVAVLAYDAIAPAYAAGASTPGSAILAGAGPAADIRAARRAGADLVIVYPHWGIEYRATATASQRSWAHRMIDAGADIVIGNHPHWAAAMEVYRGRPIWYALGDFVFDQIRSEETEEALLLELTFSGATLVQARMRPTLTLDASQPNLLDAASGRVVLDRVFTGSGRLLPW
ncbi:MAG: CapA family protein, partial [Chloroflexi bacterium]|nr:CapA family protein [Chloroflexota bacterium]